MINIIILGKLLYIGIKNWIQSLSDVFWNRNFKPALCIEGYTLANFEKNTTTERKEFLIQFFVLNSNLESELKKNYIIFFNFYFKIRIEKIKVYYLIF